MNTFYEEPSCCGLFRIHTLYHYRNSVGQASTIRTLCASFPVLHLLNTGIVERMSLVNGWSKIMDTSPCWKWYKMKALDETETTPTSVSLDIVSFMNKNLRMLCLYPIGTYRTSGIRKIVFSSCDLKLCVYWDFKWTTFYKNISKFSMLFLRYMKFSQHFYSNTD
jgi:hypothetical protein